MASIYKRGRAWYLSAYINGRRVRKRVGKSKKLAELARQEIEVRTAKGELGWEEIRNPHFHEFKKEYLRYIAANSRPATYVRYKEALEHFTDFLRAYDNQSPKLSQMVLGGFGVEDLFFRLAGGAQL